MNVLHVAETGGLAVLGVGQIAAGIGVTGYVCFETGGLMCVAAMEAAPAFVMSGYFLAKGSIQELGRMFNQPAEGCP